MATPIQIPNMNPTGVIGSGSGNTPMPGQQGTAFSGTSTGGAGNMNFGNTMNPQPTAMTSSSSMFPGATAMSSGSTVTGESGQTSTSANAYNQTQRQQDRTLGELQDYYGEGMGSMIYQYLQSGGGYNSALTQQAVDAQIEAMQHQISTGANDLTSRLAAMGITGASSSMGLSLGDYMSQAVAQENAITAQEYYTMWNESQNRELSMMKDAANINAIGTANQSSWMDYLSQGMDLAGQFVDTAGKFGFGI